jgi:hypothetical protein
MTKENKEMKNQILSLQKKLEINNKEKEEKDIKEEKNKNKKEIIEIKQINLNKKRFSKNNGNINVKIRNDNNDLLHEQKEKNNSNLLHKQKDEKNNKMVINNLDKIIEINNISNNILDNSKVFIYHDNEELNGGYLNVNSTANANANTKNN